MLAVGIIGATVMPHAVYLHSGLTQARIPTRDESEKRAVVRISNTEVVIALAIAGMVNMAMVMMASSAFHAGHSDVAEIETAIARHGAPHTVHADSGPAMRSNLLRDALTTHGVELSPRRRSLVVRLRLHRWRQRLEERRFRRAHGPHPEAGWRLRAIHAPPPSRPAPPPRPRRP